MVAGRRLMAVSGRLPLWFLDARERFAVESCCFAAAALTHGGGRRAAAARLAAALRSGARKGRLAVPFHLLLNSWTNTPTQWSGVSQTPPPPHAPPSTSTFAFQ